jgi:acetyl/propionyl-CoA carboxylase alpha subunit
MYREISINGGDSHKVQLSRGVSQARVVLDAKSMNASLRQVGEAWRVSIDGLSTMASFVLDKENVLIHAFGRTWRLQVVDPAERALQSADQSDTAKAPMPGVAISVMVAPGDTVALGQTMVIIESMKMQMEIQSSRSGVVDQVCIRQGDTFPLGAALVTLVPQEAGVV